MHHITQHSNDIAASIAISIDHNNPQQPKEKDLKIADMRRWIKNQFFTI